MSRLATSFVLGYHGCDAATAQKAAADGVSILQSDKDYDWLGPGAYFWEADPVRALEWARWKVSRGEYAQASVVGAVIDLRNCLDLVSREDLELFRSAHASFSQLRTLSDLPMPENKNPKGSENEDRVLRYLDCAVFRHLHEMIERQGRKKPSIEPFDTVRGMFVEGGPIFKGSGIYRKSHVQIAVRNFACVNGLFFPLGDGRRLSG